MPRGEFCWLAIRPNVAVLIFVPGLPNFARLKALNASARNCTRTRSLTGTFLNTEISKFFTPGPLKFGIIRGALPKANGSLNENTLVVKNSLSRSVMGPLLVALTPLQFGRWVPEKAPLALPPMICKGPAQETGDPIHLPSAGDLAPDAAAIQKSLARPEGQFVHIADDERLGTVPTGQRPLPAPVVMVLERRTGE